MIVCLGWGSLIWDPRTLPRRGRWRLDGPRLPIEFAREAADKRITLVVTEGAPVLDVLWIELDVPSLVQAKRALAHREKITDASIERDVGYCDGGQTSPYPIAATVAAWAEQREVGAVVWTGLRPGFREKRGTVPAITDVLGHLRGLDGGERDRAERYIRRAPEQIRTPYRDAIQRELGWTFVGTGAE